MQNTDLKQGTFFTRNDRENTVERYIVENHEDLKLFFKAFPQSRKMMEITLSKSLDEGHIILLTDLTISGFNSYCFETVVDNVNDLDNVHPSSFIRVVEFDRETFEGWTASELFHYLQALYIIDEDEEFEDWKNDRTGMIDMAVDNL